MLGQRYLMKEPIVHRYEDGRVSSVDIRKTPKD